MSEKQHNHEHGHHHHAHGNNILAACLLNLFFVILEIIGGIFTHSISIVSEAIHDIGDTISLFVAFILDKISQKKPDKNYTYGYHRYSLLGSLVTAVVLLIGSAVMIINAIERIKNPVEINYDGMFIVAIIGFVINLLGFKITHKTSHVNEKMVSLHLLEDTLKWIVVILISIIMKFTNVALIDPIASIIITLYILYEVIKNLKEVFEIMLDKVPKDIKIDEIIPTLKEKFKIVDAHHIHVWTLDGEKNFLTMHLVVEKDTKSDKIIEIKKDIKEFLNDKNIEHVTIEIEYEDENCNECNV